MIAFGPVPSRRLGLSLGINHIPPKNCPYSCVYCQVGRTSILGINRRKFFSPQRVVREVEKKVSDAAQKGRTIDYLSLVPDGEPTLDINLGEIIDGLKQFGIPIAVISNAALIDQADVREAILRADWVSVKVDAVQDADWHQIDRPFGRLSLPSILSGILKFRGEFTGELVTETMLVSGINDHELAIRKLAEYLNELQPFKSYLSIPTRPPAETWVKPPDIQRLNKVLTLLAEKISFIDLLFDAEESDFVSTGILIEDILSVTAVHPIREEALRGMLARADANWTVVDALVSAGKIECIEYRDDRFYLRCFDN